LGLPSPVTPACQPVGRAPALSLSKLNVSAMDSSLAKTLENKAIANNDARGVSRIDLERTTHRLPAGVSAIHVLRIESGVAELDGGLAADVKAVRAVNDHRFRFGKLTHPLLKVFGIAPPGTVGNVLQARDSRAWAHVDDLDGLAGRHHVSHFLHADGRDVA